MDSKTIASLYDSLKINNKVIGFHSLWSFLKFVADEELTHRLIQKIENRMRKYKDVSINITGKFEYETTHNTKEQFNIKFNKNHFYLQNENREKTKGKSYTEREPIMYVFNRENTSFDCFDGEEYFTLTVEKFNAEKSNPVSSNYVFINSKYFGKSLMGAYTNFITIANNLKEATKNTSYVINLFKTGTYSRTTADYFYETTKHITFDKLTRKEEIFILNAKRCGLIYSDRTYTGEAFQYDIISAYPSVLLSNLSLPIQQGQEMIISQEEFENKPFINLGLYRCVIKKPDQKWLFMENKKNIYTSYEVEYAKKNNFSIKMIEDGEINFIYYGKTTLPYKKIFEPMVKPLFKLKNDKVEGAKQIMNLIWGYLSRKKQKTIIYDVDDDFINIPDGYELDIDDVKFGEQISENKIRYVLRPKEGYFEGENARIAPFITAIVRVKMYEILQRHFEEGNIKRIHTDGFISSKDLEFDEGDIIGNKFKTVFGNDIGNLRDDGHCDNIEIKHLNNIVCHCDNKKCKFKKQTKKEQSESEDIFI